MNNTIPLELYIHIPFCVKKCAYCDFLSFPADEETREQYVGALIREIKAAGSATGIDRHLLETVFFGGGTPSVLSGSQIGRIMEAVRCSFALSDQAEITVECNPGTVDSKKLQAFSDAGINRLSFGLQSADAGELDLLGRIHSFADFEESFRLAREAGFSNINVDLMFALPGQDTGSLRKTIKTVVDLKPEHISLYSLILEPGTPFFERYSRGEKDSGLPSDEEDRKMYASAVRLLKQYGYERYEISNFALPGFSCRHNEGYWTGTEYLGVGLGASGMYGGFRYRNETDLREWLNRIENTDSPAADDNGLYGLIPGLSACEIHEVSEKEQIEEFMFLGMRRMAGVSEKQFKKRFAYDLNEIFGEKLRALKEQRLIKRQGSLWSLTARGIDVSNRVFSSFMLDQVPPPKERVSVRELVEFLYRGGDLDRVSVRGSSGIEAMLIGAAIHRMIQKSRTVRYEAEVPLSVTIPLDTVTLTVEGRADGIEDNLIEEIKSTSGRLEDLDEPEAVHLAQAKCYAAIYAKEQGLTDVRVRITYCQTETKKTKEFDQSFQAAALWEWMIGLFREYEKWAYLRAEGKRIRDKSIAGLTFPYQFREGQKRLIAAVYRTICDGRQLFAQAPTGAGKTLATLYPAVQALGEGTVTKVWYLTAKTVTRTAAFHALRLLTDHGLRIRAVTLTGRARICPNAEPVCDPMTCRYAKGHFDRVREALFELLSQTPLMDREAIETVAERHRVCPYALAADAVKWADIVVCDYNYVLDPTARFTDYFRNGRKKSDLFLIDEAHNLVERARGMYSAVIVKSDLLAVRRLMTDEKTDGLKTEELTDCLTRLNKAFLVWKKAGEFNMLTQAEIPVDLIQKTQFAIDALIGRAEQKGRILPDELWDLYFGLIHFIDMFECMDERFCLYTTNRSHSDASLHLYCLDPSGMLSGFLNEGVSTVFFSATLLPIAYYEKLLTTAEDYYDLYAATPFDPSHLRILIGSDLTSLYRTRSDVMYERYARYIEKTVEARGGHYLVFFPSYRFLEEVAGHLDTGAGTGDDVLWLTQKSSMTEGEKDAFLAEFAGSDGRTRVGLCVLGGAFSEGIDLRGSSLIGVIVVGTGIPQVGDRLNLTKEYFDKTGLDGFSYTYAYPGFNKVMQAVGRVIRTAEDRGVALLLDERFDQARYRRLFPREWKDVHTCTIGTVEDEIRSFWSEELR